MPTLKPKFACFTCRKMFRIDPMRTLVTDKPVVCPDCGALMRRVNRDFRPPRRDDKQAWESAELLYLTGHNVASDAEAGSRQRIDRVGQAKRYIEANPLSESDTHRKSEGERLLAKYRKRTRR
jgi:hypothetical protein